MYIFHENGDIYVLYEEQREMYVSLFITIPTTPLSAFANPLPACIT